MIVEPLKPPFVMTELGYVENEIYKVDEASGKYRVINTEGRDVGTLGIYKNHRRMAFDGNYALQAYMNKAGKKTYRKVPMDKYEALVRPMDTSNATPQVEVNEDHNVIKDFIHMQSSKLKPVSLVMSDLKWKYLVRSAVRAKNIMMVGHSGGGKTFASKCLVKALDRPDFYFNLGSTQDPRATLVGNTQFNKDSGTFFSESAFVKAIKTPNAVILLDELSRAHPDAWNILMSVLDQGQRYLRLDEAEGSPIVEVADGVTFIATANIGNEYTSTRVMDRAILDRFVTIEMDLLDDKQEFGLLKYMFSDVDDYDLNAIAEIAHNTRVQATSEDGKVTAMVSTRASIEMAGLMYDGFTLQEAAEIAIYPFFADDGGVDSERTWVKQLVQKYIKTDTDKDQLFDSQNADASASKADADDDAPLF